MNLLATAVSFTSIVNPVVEILDWVLPAALALVVAVGAIWCIVLGVKYAKAEEAQDRDKAKDALRNAIIGFVLIFVLIAVLYVAKDPLTEWMEDYVNNNK